jgi:hypothetical protein
MLKINKFLNKKITKKVGGKKESEILHIIMTGQKECFWLLIIEKR